MPPLDVSWNPFEEFKYQNCFNTLESLLIDYNNYCINNLKSNSFSYIQTSITSTIVSTRLFFDDTVEFGEIVISPIPIIFEEDEFIDALKDEMPEVFRNIDINFDQIE